VSTPLQLSIAIHYYMRPGDYGRGNGDNNWDAPAVQDQIEQMAKHGLLRDSPRDGQRYEATPGLDAFITSLRAVPWPVQKWVTPTA